MSAETAAIIVAAGRGERMAGADKLWAPVAGRPLLAHTIAAFEACGAIDRVVLVVAKENLERGRELAGAFATVRDVVAGGATRQESVRAGLDALDDAAWVVVHDGARPLVTPDLIERGFEAARETGAACCALPAPDTVKEANEAGAIARTLDRSRLWLAQTPQVVRYDLLVEAHRRAEGLATDDAALVEALGVEVRLYEGSPRNLKVTTPDDLAIAEALLR